MIIPILATVVILAPLAWLWQASLLPKSLSVMDMGYADYGGGPVPAHDHHGQGVSVSDLRADPTRRADARFELTTEQATLTVGDKAVSGYTVNGTSPGPTITAVQGQLIEVHLTNVSVADGVALHWHGIDVPNSMDGVAGVTQDAVPVGGEFTYRFVAEQAGTYWYHSHQVSDKQVTGGLFGALVIKPRTRIAQPVEVLAVAHTYGGVKTLNGKSEDLRMAAKPGSQVRLRVINTDNGSIETWAGSPFRVLAIDGYDVHEPTDAIGKAVTLTGGARVDLGVTMPADGSPVRVQVSKATAVILGTGDPATAPQPADDLDLLSYGTRTALPFEVKNAARHFEYSIGHRPGFVRGKPGLWWSINGHLYPNVPMYVVRDGDIVTMHIDNHSGEVHPMHLHGHHAVVLARNGVAATGSQWWFDSLNVADKDNYDIAFVADNPGVWMDHCHNLQHAVDGMVAHLMYAGVTTPYVIGGEPDNQPE
jgi:FtsP/CotA-like multicopper oxidase with cupredoxin domain